MRWSGAAAAVVGSVVLGAAGLAAQQVVERTKVDLVLIDVNVADDDGLPVAGLDPGDFSLKLDRREWPIYSVDDFCGAVDALEEAPGGTVRPASRTDDLLRPRYLIYIDFSQLQNDGRVLAFEAAARWARDVKRPEDLALVVVHSSVGGIQQLTPFTSDKEEILLALHQASEDSALIDMYPLTRFFRQSDCNSCIRNADPRCLPSRLACCAMCSAYPREELLHTRRGLETLEEFMASLKVIPGRKVLLFFHQNTTLSPGFLYPVSEQEARIGNLDKDLENLGAEATSARVEVYPISVRGRGMAVEVGRRLAGFTGGRYNRNESDLDRVLEDSVNRERCIYRIGFEPPDRSKSRNYPVSVSVRGLETRFEYMIRYLTDSEKVVQRAQGIITWPEAVSDLNLRASVTPLRSNNEGWDLALRLVLEVDSIGLLPETGGLSGELDVGAVFYERGSRKSWEMVTGTTLKVPSSQEGNPGSLVYAHTLSGLAPGKYRFRAFVRNRILDSYGGGSFDLILPDRDKPSILGPFPYRRDQRLIELGLPLKGKGKDELGQRAIVRTGPLPTADLQVDEGEVFTFVTWLCGVDEPPSVNDTNRRITRDGRAAYAVGRPGVESSGPCLVIFDHMSSRGVQAGSYTYEIKWRPRGAEPVLGRKGFQVAAVTTSLK